MMSPDVEGQEERRPLAANSARPGSAPSTPSTPNPYSSLPPPSSLPPDHWYYKVKRTCVLVLSLYGLHLLEAWHAVLRGPNVRHGWFKMGLAASVAILAIKSYMELYEGKFRGRRVEYDNYRGLTHLLILLILLASASFQAALSPHYGGAKAALVLGLFGWGVLIPLSLLLPTYVQNVVGVVGMTLFVQMYR